MLRVGTAVLALLAAATVARADASTVGQLLKDGYEIKTAFSDGTGGAYIVLQKGSGAYMCHSSPRQTCEKLN